MTGTQISTIVENRRPGKKSAVPDETLTTDELDRRNRIRQRNKEAAQRVRDRRVQRMQNLETKVAELERERKMLQEDNMILRCALMVKNTESNKAEQAANFAGAANFHRQISNTEPMMGSIVSELDQFSASEPASPIDIYPNGDGQSALLVTSDSAFILTTIRHQIQLTVESEPQRPTSMAHFNAILNSL